MRLDALWGLVAALLLVGGACSADEVSTKPHIDTTGVNLQPPYPETAMQNRERGMVVLGVAVTAEGKVSRISLVATSGFNDLDASAIATVLDWRFLPATKNGSPAEGTTTINLVFEPPAAASDVSASGSPPPPTPRPLFPARMEMKAAVGHSKSVSTLIPCKRGELDADVDIEPGAKSRDKPPALIVKLSAGIEAVRFVIHQYGPSPLVGAFLARDTNDEVVTSDNYYGSGETGTPIGISVRWDPAGNVVGNGGLVFGSHRTSLGKIPERLEVSGYSGEITVCGPRLVCLPER